MPLFTEHASRSRDLRVLPSLASPLPRLTPEFDYFEDGSERYEVVIVGVGRSSIQD